MKPSNGRGVFIGPDLNNKQNVRESIKRPPNTLEPTFAQTLWQNYLKQRPPAVLARSILVEMEPHHRNDRYKNGMPNITLQPMFQVEPQNQARKKQGSHRSPSQCCVIQ